MLDKILDRSLENIKFLITLLYVNCNRNIWTFAWKSYLAFCYIEKVLHIAKTTFAKFCPLSLL